MNDVSEFFNLSVPGVRLFGQTRFLTRFCDLPRDHAYNDHAGGVAIDNVPTLMGYLLRDGGWSFPTKMMSVPPKCVLPPSPFPHTVTSPSFPLPLGIDVFD